MNLPVPSVLEMGQFAASLPAKLSKDQRRIRLFTADLPNVAVRLAKTEPDKVDDFARESGELMQKWIEALGKISWNNLNDPFKNARNDARKFAAKWQMSPVVIKELG